MTKKNVKVDANIVREFLLFDPHTGIFTWKERSLPWFKREQDWKAWNNRFANKPAGYIRTDKNGYCSLVIRIFGMNYFGTKLAYLWMYGGWPNGNLTHADGNSLNLRIDNLLEDMVGKGKRIHANNKSGVTGVSWCKRFKRWKAAIMFKGEYHYLGCYKDFEQAEAVVQNFYRDHGFLPHHGKEPTPDAA